MKRVEVLSYPVSIFIAGDSYKAAMACGDFCDEVGLCVTITETAYIYTEGAEAGVVVGLINYPRFPAEPREIWARAEALAMFLRERLGQESFTIQAPDKTVWFSWRPADFAQAGEAGTAETQSGSVHKHAVPKGDAPK